MKITDYPQALAWLYDTQQHGIKLGMENIRRLLDALGWKSGAQKFLHVAGTNGKGSVCAMMDAILRAEGVRAGLFTSPHLVTFRERIRVDGEMISEDEARAGLVKIRDIVSGWETAPTFFEITTALALDHFQSRCAGVAVLETGMGGRLDATNAVTPAACAITPVAIDHAQWLGDTLEKIAAEKAGIIKPGVPVVSAPQHPEVARVLREVAAGKSTPLHFISGPLEGFALALAGSHQKLNAALAVETLRAARIDTGEDAIRRGLGEVEWPGRFQQIEKSKIKNPVVLDGAHNESAAHRLAQTWREVFGGERATLILSVVQDKDVAAVCRELLPVAAGVVVTPTRSPRTSSAEALREIVHALAPDVPCATACGVSAALDLASSMPRRILVAGSLFLVGEALAVLSPGVASCEASAQ